MARAARKPTTGEFPVSLIERYEAGESFGDLLAEADTKLLALENDGMELAAKLGDAEHQLQEAVTALVRIAALAESERAALRRYVGGVGLGDDWTIGVLIESAVW